MFELLFIIFIFFVLFKFLVSLGFGITKLVFSLLGLALLLVIIPVSLALIVPVLVFLGFIFVVVSIIKAIA